MRKKIWLILTCLFLILSLSGCGKIVSREDYDKLSKELAEAKAKVASLEKDLSIAQGKYLKITVYVAFLDLLMYPIFVVQDIPTTRYNFESVQAWRDKVKAGATMIGDNKLIEYADKIVKNEIGVTQVIDYVIGKILEEAAS